MLAYDAKTRTLINADTCCNTIGLWSLKTGKCLNIRRAPLLTLGVFFNIHHSPILVHTDNGYINVESLQTRDLQVLQGHEDDVLSATYDAKSNTLFTGSDDETIRVWSLETGECLKVLKVAGSGLINSLAYNARNNVIIGAYWDGNIRLWSLETGECLKTLAGGYYESGVRSVIYNSEKDIIVTGGDCDDPTVRVWLPDGACLILEGHTDMIFDLIYDAVTDTVISQGGASDDTIRVWSATTGECLKVFDMNWDKDASATTGACWKVFRANWGESGQINGFQKCCFRGLEIIANPYSLCLISSYSFSQLAKVFEWVFYGEQLVRDRLFDLNTLRIVEGYWS